MKIKLLDEKCAPVKGTEGSAGWDLKVRISDSIRLHSMQRVTVPTGICVEIPPAFVGDIRPRSGLAKRHGIVATYGTIDSDYRGEICVTLINLSSEPYEIQPYERVAQLVLVRISMEGLEIVNELSSTERGQGGFGSTGRF